MGDKRSGGILFSSLCVIVLVSACASSRQGGPEDPGGGDGGPDGGGGGGKDPDMRFDWGKDPPPMYCLLEVGNFTPPKPPGGTAECPDDKNLEGCPCPRIGDTAACWPGLRIHRGQGNCRDGTTTCRGGEVEATWGPCVGAVLPIPGAPGRAGCQCFSRGRWDIKNLSPCFYGSPAGSQGAASTYIDANGRAQCQSGLRPPMLPSQPWSTNTVTVDCVGHFKLCYTLKAGKADNPQPTDCKLAESCTEADYPKIDVPQAFPVLPAWSNADAACAMKFADSGYGEMSVVGKSVLCENVGPKVFLRVQYCPLRCNTMPNLPECKDCMQGGGGDF
jgi:hypothetical protein